MAASYPPSGPSRPVEWGHPQTTRRARAESISSIRSRGRGVLWVRRLKHNDAVLPPLKAVAAQRRHHLRIYGPLLPHHPTRQEVTVRGDLSVKSTRP
eukprot:7431592-Pyramimonas_sp.AAC.2